QPNRLKPMMTKCSTVSNISSAFSPIGYVYLKITPIAHYRPFLYRRDWLFQSLFFLSQIAPIFQVIPPILFWGIPKVLFLWIPPILSVISLISLRVFPEVLVFRAPPLHLVHPPYRA